MSCVCLFVCLFICFCCLVCRKRKWNCRRASAPGNSDIAMKRERCVCAWYTFSRCCVSNLISSSLPSLPLPPLPPPPSPPSPSLPSLPPSPLSLPPSLPSPPLPQKSFTGVLASRHHQHKIKARVWGAWFGIIQHRWKNRVEKACQVIQ